MRKFKKLNPFSKKSFALNNLDLKLWPYLNFRNGFFIEAGANNGVKQSNTLYLEKYKKWTGILIEPVPELAETCKINRPNCLVVNVALVPFDYKDEYIEMRYCNLMSLVKGAMASEEEELEHIRKGCEIQNVTTYELRVQAKTLTSVLDIHSIRNIDLLSLDVEGFEIDALKGIDFEKYKPLFILIEARDRAEIDSFLISLYEPIAELSHHDVLYKLR